MKPVIALIGRPNVGKSTLFNQITKSRDALVADFAGLTRDRKYGDAVFQNKSFIVVDTGGIGENEGGIDTYMAEQSKTAIHEADIIIFVVDARAVLLASDEQIARELRTLGKKVYLVANKVDGVHAEAALVEFYKLGMGEPLQVAASHGRGVQQMLEDVLADGRFSVGIAAHPELHPRSPDRVTDRKFLAAKLSRADFAITQFFFDLDVYVQMVNELADLGVTKPILPGIMPVTNKNQIRRMAELSGAAFPAWLAERLDRTDDAEEIRRIGVDAATELCQGLLNAGAPGLHFYTMNRSTATSEIYANLGLSPTR